MKKLVALDTFKSKINEDSLLDTKKLNLFRDGCTTINESYSTTAASGFGYNSDTEKWVHPDGGGPGILTVTGTK